MESSDRNLSCVLLFLLPVTIVIWGMSFGLVELVHYYVFTLLPASPFPSWRSIEFSLSLLLYGAIYLLVLAWIYWLMEVFKGID